MSGGASNANYQVLTAGLGSSPDQLLRKNMRAVVTSPSVPIVVEALVLAPSDPVPRHGCSKDAVAQSALILTHPSANY